MKRILYFTVAILVILACSENNTTLDVSIPVTINIIEPTAISEIVYAPCRLEAGNEAIISVSTPSVVEQVLVVSGDTVMAGEKLFVLQSDDFQRALISNAFALLTAARASSEYASSNFRRAEELLLTGAISTEEFNRIETENRVSKANLQMAISAHSASQASAQKQFVLAPFDGVVGRIIATEGNTASGALMNLSSTEILKAELLVAPNHIYKLRVGLPAVFTTDHFPGSVFAGTVVSVSNTADPISGLVSLSVQFSDTTGALIPGLSGTTMLFVATNEEAIVLPAETMTFVKNNVWEIFRLNNGCAQKIFVETGIRNRARYEIVDGLAFGDTVINLGHTLLSNGEAVRVVN